MTEKKKKVDEEVVEPAAGEQAAEPAVDGPDLAAEVENLNKQLQEAQAKSQEYLEALQRERADFMNYRRRTDLENAQIGRMASGTTIKKFLVAIDDLERALAHRTPGDAWADGIELVYRKLLSVLEAEGVTRMQAEGQPFDPNLHEAIMQEPSENHASGTVMMVLQQGYMHGERVLRPALVKVAQ